MQLVRIWHLKERLSEDTKKNMYERSGEKTFFLFNLSVHLDRSDIVLMSKRQKKIYHKEIKIKQNLTLSHGSMHSL